MRLLTKYLKPLFLVIQGIITVFISNFYLQLTQNNLSWHLATLFTFNWHTEKFLLGCLVLLCLLGTSQALLGSWWLGSLVYLVVIGSVGIANYLKLHYRMEPLYPEDLKRVTELSLIKDILGGPLFWGSCFLLLLLLSLIIYHLMTRTKKSWQRQVLRLSCLLLCLGGLGYAKQFNREGNLLRHAFDRTALWIPYSQKMNYYNTGFVGGFLYNLDIQAMAKPQGYSKEKIEEIVSRYQKIAPSKKKDPPNIVYIMSESFSDPLSLKGIEASQDPLAPYRQLQQKTFSGQMLSQNYGGGTANIEFEALTGFSMEALSPQLTTPYTMLVPKLNHIPSLVTFLKDQGYQTSAIHPYNTSMYKRQAVYDKMGFEQFLSEKELTYQEKIEKNPYISDASVFKEVLSHLQKKEQAQFIHLVTMQTHMPYQDKYQPSNNQVTGVTNPLVLDNYLQDVGYTSRALVTFLKELAQLPKRTLVVFWGDHLPGIYSENFQENQESVALHLTEFLMYDTAKDLTTHEYPNKALSPIYFAPMLFDLAGLPQSGFYYLLNSLYEDLPAFEKESYLQDNKWQKEKQLTKAQQAVYDDYVMIQYDNLAGQQYSQKLNFFKETRDGIYKKR